MSAPVLSVKDLSVTYAGGVRAVSDVTFSVARNETVALVGESGCGKTTIARALLGLLPPGTAVRGSIQIAGMETVGLSERARRSMRGLVVGYVPQDPFAACDPLRRVGHHIREAWRCHGQRPLADEIARRVGGLGIIDPEQRIQQWPHQWSGGMLQRAGIAAAGAHHPALIVADEPTSALDTNLALGVLRTLRATSQALLLISHDLDLVAGHTDRIAICYAGRIVEIGPARRTLSQPRHPYTRALVTAVPRPGHGLPKPLPGAAPNPARRGRGCPFAPRCSDVTDRCLREDPELLDGVACWEVHR